MNYTIFVSSRCKYCNELMVLVNGKDGVNVVNIDKQRAPQWVRSVPTMIDDKKNIYVGKECFDKFKTELEGFEFCGGGAEFSYIEDGLMEKTNNFSYIEENKEVNEGNDETKMMIDRMVEQRNSEVPQPIQRV
jgi:hypothetical protein